MSASSTAILKNKNQVVAGLSMATRFVAILRVEYTSARTTADLAPSTGAKYTNAAPMRNARGGIARQSTARRAAFCDKANGPRSRLPTGPKKIRSLTMRDR